MTVHLGQAPSIAHHYLSILRDVSEQQSRMNFRYAVERLGEIMAYEISKVLDYQAVNIQTPLGTKKQSKLKQEPVLVTVLRAGLPYFTGFQRVFEKSDCGFIGAYRQEGQEIKIKVDYVASPTLEGKDLILIDPMLATGKSMVDAVQQLKKKGKPKRIILAALIAAPEGIAYIESQLGKDFPVWVFAVDEKLNQQSYIVPGLGDAGDLSFGEKI
jgi:uracil phosphoribosyltransferase